MEKSEVTASRLLIECAKFAALAMVSVGVCVKEAAALVKGRLNININYHINDLFLNLVEDWQTA